MSFANTLKLIIKTQKLNGVFVKEQANNTMKKNKKIRNLFTFMYSNLIYETKNGESLNYVICDVQSIGPPYVKI